MTYFVQMLKSKDDLTNVETDFILVEPFSLVKVSE